MKKNKIEHYSDKEALEFHNSNKSGKIEINSSKPMTSKRDLALAYSPGVAVPVKEIYRNPEKAYDHDFLPMRDDSHFNLIKQLKNLSEEEN